MLNINNIYIFVLAKGTKYSVYFYSHLQDSFCCQCIEFLNNKNMSIKNIKNNT